MTESTSDVRTADQHRPEHVSEHVAEPAAAQAADRPRAGAEPARTVTPADRRVIWLLLAAAFTVILNETIMGVAIPHLQVDLGISLTAAQWLTTGFMLTMAVVIPITGYLLQRFPTRPVFIVAMSLFSAGTLLAALAPGFEVLLAARVVQAGGTAIMMPLLMTTLMELVPPHERGRFMGRVSTVISVAPAIGPTLSGLILNFLSWRFMFWFVLPIALVMLVLGIRKVENVNDPKPTPIDALSVVLAAFGFGGLVFGLSRIGEAGAADAATLWVPLGVGALGLASFIARQLRLQRRDRALLDLRTFRSRNFAISVVVMAIMMMALFGTLILLPVYLQQVLGLDPLYAGLLLLPGGLLMGLIAPLVGRLYDRFGATALLVPGSALVSAVLWWLTTVGAGTAVGLVLAAHLTLSLGLAFVFTPLFTASLGSVAPPLYSPGSAIVGTVQQVAGAAGTALFVTIAAAASHLAAGAPADPDAVAAGVRAAFLVGAVISLGAVVGSAFVRKPADAPEGFAAH